MKDILIIVLALATVFVAVTFQPWAELGFGLDPNGLSDYPTSILAQPLRALAKSYEPLTSLAKDIQKQVAPKMDPDVANNPFAAGSYAYALFLFVAMGIAAVAIMLIGREESEEKTVLPVKK